MPGKTVEQAELLSKAPLGGRSLKEHMLLVQGTVRPN